MSIVSIGQITIVDQNDGLSAVLTNESYVLTANGDGQISSYAGCTTTLKVYQGGTDVTSSWTVSATPSTGVVGTLAGSTYTVTSIPGTASAYVDFTATKPGFANLTKRFAITVMPRNATLYRQGTQPTGGTYSKGDTWVDTSSSPLVSYQYDGSSWSISSNYLTRYQELDGLADVYDTFGDATGFANDWEVTTSLTSSVTATATVTGGTLQINVSKANTGVATNSYIVLRHRRLVKFDPDLLYKVSVSGRPGTDLLNGLAATMYAGVASYYGSVRLGNDNVYPGTATDIVPCAYAGNVGSANLLDGTVKTFSMEGFVRGRSDSTVLAYSDQRAAPQFGSASKVPNSTEYVSLVFMIKLPASGSWAISSATDSFQMNISNIRIQCVELSSIMTETPSYRETFYNNQITHSATMTEPVYVNTGKISIPAGVSADGSKKYWVVGNNQKSTTLQYTTFDIVPNYIYAAYDETAANNYKVAATTIPPLYYRQGPNGASLKYAPICITDFLNPYVYNSVSYFRNEYRDAGSTDISNMLYGHPGTTHTSVTSNGQTLSGRAFSTDGLRFLKGPTDATAISQRNMMVMARFKCTSLPASGAYQVLFQLGTYGIQLQLYNNGTATYLRLYASSNGTSWDLANGTLGATAINSNTWYIFGFMVSGYIKTFLMGNSLTPNENSTISIEHSVLSSNIPVLKSFGTSSYTVGGSVSGTNIFIGLIGDIAVLPFVADPREYYNSWYYGDHYKVYFDEAANRYKKANSGVLTKDPYRAYIGERNSTGVVAYESTNAYDSGWFSVLVANTSVSLQHNLGGDPFEYSLQIFAKNSDGMVVEVFGRTANGTSYYGAAPSYIDSTSITIKLLGDVSGTKYGVPLAIATTADTSCFYRVVISRRR